MDKFTIDIAQDLKLEMERYELDWSQVCSEAIRLKIESIKTNYNALDQLVDIDIDSKYPQAIKISQSQKNDKKTINLDPNFYFTFREVWLDFYDWLHPTPKPPTSKQIKDLWKLWYDPSFDQGSWYQSYEKKTENSSYINSLSENGKEQWELFTKFAQEWGEDLSYTGFGEFITKFVYEGELLNITELNPFEFESVTLEDKNDLPPSSGIYFVIDTDKIYYIGMSKNLRNRWYSHHRQKDLNVYENLKISYIDSLPVHYLKSIETIFIKHFKPKLNIQENPLIKAV
ncbi:MAG: GIY-YIG nuclease family protein [Crocosphaera sp.]